MIDGVDPVVAAGEAVSTSGRAVLVAATTVSIVIRGVLAVPLFSIRLGHVDDGADPTSYTDRRAYDLIAQGFGPGANGPFTIVVQLPAGASATSSSGQALAQKVGSALASTAGVAHTTPLQPTEDGALLVGNAVPTTSPQAAATTSLFHHLYDTTLPSALHGSGAKGYVTGATASYIEFAASLAATLPIIIAVVVACAFLLIMTAFRSLLLAVKAAVLNLISISAAYGMIVAVFQWGWGRQLLGVSGTVPIQSYVPLFMFAIVFGLSTDYEIFLLSQVKEHGTRPVTSTSRWRRGLSSTGRVITCAAPIMASVFLAFVASGDVVIKQLAVGLSASVLDATIVRLLLVPAVMYLLGRSSWWLPGWLDRLPPPRRRRTGGTGQRPSRRGAGRRRQRLSVALDISAPLGLFRRFIPAAGFGSPRQKASFTELTPRSPMNRGIAGENGAAGSSR
ncbi:MAG TPA: MMPL family transporter [Acidimicrobiales bacterium]|nr:MMPL family transporter [Acidimicrobiales bacterium]